MNRTIILVIGFVLIASFAFAGGVVDNNNGNLGDVFVSTGERQGSNDIGTWTNADFLKGKKGEQGEPGIGIAGKDGVNGIDGKDGQSIKGDKSTGLKDRKEVTLEIRVADTKHTTWAVYGIRDFNNKIDTIGIKCTIKLGKSYLEKRIEELEKRIKETKDIDGSYRKNNWNY